MIALDIFERRPPKLSRTSIPDMPCMHVFFLRKFGEIERAREIWRFHCYGVQLLVPNPNVQHSKDKGQEDQQEKIKKKKNLKEPTWPNSTFLIISIASFFCNTVLYWSGRYSCSLRSFPIISRPSSFWNAVQLEDRCGRWTRSYIRGMTLCVL